MAIGDNFNATGTSSLMVLHGTICAKPCADLSTASFQRSAAAAGSFADLCGPRFKAASICSRVHGVPQSTGQPREAYSCSNRKAGCRQAGPVGHMRPRIFDLPMRFSISSGNVSDIGAVVGSLGLSFILLTGSATSFQRSALSTGHFAGTGVSIVFLSSRKSQITRFSFVGLSCVPLAGTAVVLGPGGRPGWIILCSPGGGWS
eukprot:scaffold113069_cov30-Attheya_sp.AAC.1